METTITNRVQLMGNLGKDPEVREFEGGKRRARFSLATTEQFSFGNGNSKEDTQWHQITAWGKSADEVMQMLKKGSRISLDGRLVHGSYEGKDGQKRYFTEVVMNNFSVVERSANAASTGVAML
ncbi:MAG: single-stranded DNA-binding protein [Flavobacteriales bacterium]|nr:single-stranded DNA-binding protein [Flavobacteriales bacterium]MBL0045911.1 single-stranded DNA-binding protein [Flavobacteriales bacterium]